MSSRCSIGSPEHLVPGAAPVSSRCLQAPAGDHGPVLNQAIEYRSNAQSAIISAFQLSAIFAKPSTATVAPTPNPHSRQAFTAFPRVRSSEAFRRRPLYWVDRSRRAGIRNPSRSCHSPQQRRTAEGWESGRSVPCLGLPDAHGESAPWARHAKSALQHRRVSPSVMRAVGRGWAPSTGDRLY